jgi:hypothetical protein
VKAFSLCVVVALFSACGPPLAADTLYDDGNQGAPNCPIASTYGGQPGVPGDPCSDAALDCSPACCECPDGTDSYWASACSGGFCTDDGTACNDAPSATLCQ